MSDVETLPSCLVRKVFGGDNVLATFGVRTASTGDTPPSCSWFAPHYFISAYPGLTQDVAKVLVTPEANEWLFIEFLSFRVVDL